MGKEELKELQEFRRLCSDKDYDLVLSDKITFYDYERLGFILESLKLTELESDLLVRHMDKFRAELEYLETLDKSEGFYIDWERYNKWLEEFAENVKDEKDRKFVREMFALDEE